MPAQTTQAAAAQSNVPLGLGVPPFTPHAISVSLPLWKDNVDYEEGAQRVVERMVSGYPRFFIPLPVQKLAALCTRKFGREGESCMLLPTRKIADSCRDFMKAHSPTPLAPRLVQYKISPDEEVHRQLPRGTVAAQEVDLHLVLFPTDAAPVAKQFWQHTGMGVSSRLADHCLTIVSPDDAQVPPTSPTTGSRPSFKAVNKHYAVKKAPAASPDAVDDISIDTSYYLEERYGRNLPLAAATAAKRALRRRISGVLVQDNACDRQGEACAGQQDVDVGPSSRGVADLSEDDVFLFPTGMAAIWSAHQTALAVRPPAKSVCFGFPYTDTLKILQKWGPGCHFLGRGIDEELDELEQMLAREAAADPSKPPILALFTEFPSNPLLRTADLARLRRLADQYDFLIVVDETIGNFVNVDVLPHADIVVSSLTKIFSGDANVMGGGMVLNPRGRHYAELKAHLRANFEDVFFEQDALYLERNSRDFRRRIQVIDANTEAACDFFYARSLACPSPLPTSVVTAVYYPKYETRKHYDACRLPGGGYGGLFTLTFTTMKAAQAFYDTLACFKGPSLGTNFTLASPYAILAHYAELEWAARYGVEASLVRISVGLEERDKLLGNFATALEAAEKAAAEEKTAVEGVTAA
ncbi:pyridoxal phosphate-dependent transferase [Schizophyllum amplum]|uniref:cystathionine gamma-synthase n=1 Tax=Schizophyllum amplum TaxID=97359 RepID=A0A550CFN8_9AGAR|nr:pyridoxal phosphate-dependent transferase [Auriculariopsis ampla]